MPDAVNARIAQIPMPERIARLPVSETGFPVPWFVHRRNGEIDFRVIGDGKLVKALRLRLCWICGQDLGRIAAFVLGPMCTVNRVSSEPPSHRDCALYAVQACPFLANPRMRRNEVGLPEERIEGAGIPLQHNPGVAAVWCCRTWRPFRAPGGLLIDVGEPVEVVRWFTGGREATRAEVEAAIERGLPALEEIARSEGAAAVAALAQAREQGKRHLPAAALADA